MTPRSWIPSLMLGLAAACLPGCFPGYVAPPGPAKILKGGDPGPAEPADSSAYHAHLPPPIHDDAAVQPTHYTDLLTPGGSAPTAKSGDAPPPIPPPPPDAPTVQAAKAATESPAAAAFRDLLQNRSSNILERLRDYDVASRELLLTLLPLCARIGDGGLDHATPQEMAVLLDQVRQVEGVLRPRAALALDRVCLCRRINGFGDCEPWPADHPFQPGADGRYGERMQVYVEVRNFTCRPAGSAYETSLAGTVEICDFANPGRPAVHIDFPATVDRSQSPRQDYFINFQFHLPPMPPGRYTLRVVVKDMLAPAAADAAPRRASRSLDFIVGGPGG